jgi:hypothetical protein
MSEYSSVNAPETPVENAVETPVKRLAETLAILRSMVVDALEEHRAELVDLPEVYTHLQMIDRHTYNAILEENRSRAPAPEPKGTDLPDLVAQLAPGEKYLLRTLTKAPNGINKNMLGNENTRLIEWNLIIAEGDMLKLAERGAQINQLLNLKPSQRSAPQALAS